MTNLTLKKWSHPRTGEVRLYVNGDVEHKFWFTKGWKGNTAMIHGKMPEADFDATYREMYECETASELESYYAEEKAVEEFFKNKTFTELLAIAE